MWRCRSGWFLAVAVLGLAAFLLGWVLCSLESPRTTLGTTTIKSTPSLQELTQTDAKDHTNTNTNTSTNINTNTNGDGIPPRCCYYRPLPDLLLKFTPAYMDGLAANNDNKAWTGNEYEEWQTLAASSTLQPMEEEEEDTNDDPCVVEWRKVVLNDLRRGKDLRKYLSFLEGTKKSTPFRYMEDTPGLPRILYLGDSISMNTWPVTQDLYSNSDTPKKKLANIHSAPNNCSGFRAYEASLGNWLGDCPWDLIQFNVGAHFHPNKDNHDDHDQAGLGPYERGLVTIIERLLQHSPSAQIVLALTTPSPFDSPDTRPVSHDSCSDYDKLHKTGFVPSMNQVAIQVAARYGNQVAINDRYNAIYPVLAQHQLPCNIHFQLSGYQILAQQDWNVASELLGLDNPQIPMDLPTAAPGMGTNTTPVTTSQEPVP